MALAVYACEKYQKERAVPNNQTKQERVIQQL
jgi:hypothetical protein